MTGRDGIAKIADRIWYPVWDSGARLDHAVRTVPQARRVARNDLKVALGLLNARHMAGDPDLTTRLREGALEDWRGNARTRLAELKELHEERTRLHGELAFLLEPDLKESRGGQRDVHAIQAIAAAWVAPAPGPRGTRRLRADPRRPPRAARGHWPPPGPARARGAGRGCPHAGPARRRRAAAEPGRGGPHGRLRGGPRLPPGRPGRRPPRARVRMRRGEAGAAPARRRGRRAGRRGGAGPGGRARHGSGAGAAGRRGGRAGGPAARAAGAGPAGRVPAAAGPVAGRRPGRAAHPARRGAERRSPSGRRWTRRAC